MDSRQGVGFNEQVKIGSLERISGTTPVLLVAPHGGRRPPGPAGRKVNDLHTAEVTRELAVRTGAAAIINATTDRNRVDLNRVSEIRQHVPGLFATIRAEVERMIDDSGQATVLFIHGWNAIQPSCDVGVGASITDGRLLPVKRGVPSVPADYVPTLLAFASRARQHGIDVTFGERYPAAARENLVQALTARYRDDTDPDLAVLASHGLSGQLRAVQLELAVPLRWPGRWREGILDAIDIFFETDVRSAPSISDGSHTSGGERRSLEFHDDRAGVGVFTGIERTVDGRRFARFLLCLGRAGLVLFTGEQARGDGLQCAGFRWEDTDDGAWVRFDGPVLRFPRSDPFLDLENGLATASLAELRAKIHFETGPGDGSPFRSGRARGTIVLNGVHHIVDADAARGPSRFPEADSPWQERRRLHVPVGERDILSLASGRGAGGETVIGERVRDGRPEPLLAARTYVHSAANGVPRAWRIEIVTHSGPLRIFGDVTHIVPTIRPGPGGPWRAWFGLARFHGDTPGGAGTFEITRPLAATAPA